MNVIVMFSAGQVEPRSGQRVSQWSVESSGLLFDDGERLGASKRMPLRWDAGWASV